MKTGPVNLVGLYGFVTNGPVSGIDALGLLSPSQFWDDWTPAQRESWFADFRQAHGQLIDQAATAHCVPKELLAAIIANEQIDYSWLESVGEWLGGGQSVGLAQIQTSTAIQYGLTNHALSDFLDITVMLPDGTPLTLSAQEQFRQAVRATLMSDAGNVEAAARLMRNYLDQMCAAARAGTMSQSFSVGVAGGCRVSDFCCAAGASGANCAAINAPRCLIEAMAAAWNNGIGIMNVSDIAGQSPNAFTHALNASLLDDVFANW